MRGDGRVKGGVEASDLGEVGTGGGDLSDDGDGGRDVERGERGEGFQSCDCVLVEERRGAEGVSAVDDSVSDGAEFVLGEALFGPLEEGGGPLVCGGFPPGGFFFVCDDGAKFGLGVGEDLPAREDGVARVKERELGGGGSDVENGEHWFFFGGGGGEVRRDYLRSTNSTSGGMMVESGRRCFGRGRPGT